MHGLEKDAIVKLSTPLFIKFKLCMQKHIISMWESTAFGDQVAVNIQEGFALIYRLCFHNKDISAEVFHILLICFIILRLFHNEITREHILFFYTFQ